MKRQYLSVVLLVATFLASVSTFTSCKDYTNDISNLQAQVDKAALSTDVQTLKSQVEANAQKELATADTAKKAFDKAVANAANIDVINKGIDAINSTIKGNAEKTAARIDSLARVGAVTDTKIANLQTATKAAADSAALALAQNKEIQNTLTKWAEAKSDYYTATEIDKKLDDLADEIQNALDDSIASLKKTVEGYQTTVNALYSAVTSVSLYINSDTDAKDAFRLKFVKGKVQNNYTFGKEEKDDVDTTYTATPTSEYKKSSSFCIPRLVRVRVNPVNAKLTPSMIKLIDSEGNNLDDLLEVTSVEKYGGLLTRASMETGLWTVRLKLKDGVDNSQVDKKDPSGTKHIAYALAVNNTLSQSDAISDAAGRYVVSTYDITVEGTKAYSKATRLDSVKICNETGKMNAASWKTLGELRTDQTISKSIYAYDGENILMDFSQYADSIDRFYVAVDYGHSTVSESDMRTYWKSYNYSGFNTVYEVNSDIDPKFSVKIGNIASNLIKIRIFAVNFDGSLVENHGVSFDVNIGPKVTEASVEGDIVATTTAGKMETGWLPISGTLTNYGSLSQQIAFSGNDGNDVHSIIGTVTYASDTNGTSIGEDISKARYVKIAISDSLQYWTDGTSLTAILVGGDDPLVINRISVKLKKVMPTVEDATKFIKYRRNIASDTIFAYMKPAGIYNGNYVESWTSVGSYGVNYDFVLRSNSLHASSAPIIIDNNDDKNAKVSIENAAPNSQDGGKYTSPVILYGGAWSLIINANSNDGNTLIDSKTPHKTEVYYSFGKISSEIDDNGKYVDSYNVIVDTFQTIFTCPYDEEMQKYAWEQIPASGDQAAMDVNVLTYGDGETVAEKEKNHSILLYLKGTNKYDNLYTSSLYTLLIGEGTRWPRYVTLKEAHLYIEGTTTEPYFDVRVNTIVPANITFKPIEEATPPTKDINCTFHIELQDGFDHTHKHDLPFLVKKP